MSERKRKAISQKSKRWKIERFDGWIRAIGKRNCNYRKRSYRTEVKIIAEHEKIVFYVSYQ